MKIFFKDFGMFIGGMLIFSYIKLIMFSGLQHYDKWLLPILYGIYYGIICYVIFVITIRLLKSKVAFCILSWITVFFCLYLNIKGGKEINLTERAWGGYIYMNGDITQFGVLYKIIDPLGVMAVLATIILIINIIKKLKDKKNG